MSDIPRRCKCSKCGKVGESKIEHSIHAPLAVEGQLECGGEWKAHEKEERQPTWGKVNAAICMLKRKEDGVKHEEIALVIDDNDVKQTILITKSNAMDLVKYLKKVISKIV